MREALRGALASAAIALLSAAPRAQDTVELVDGTRIEGRVLVDAPHRLVVRAGGRERELDTAQIKSVRSLERSLEELLLRTADGLPATVAERVELAHFARGRGLTGELEYLWWAALALDPENAEAHEALEHRKARSGWQYKDAGGWHDFATAAARHTSWDAAWQFRSVHYELRTNVDLESAIALCLDLERYYAAFHELLGGTVELRLPELVLRCEVHADGKSYPEPGDHRPAHFDEASKSMQVDASKGLKLDFVFHEATHQLLFHTAEDGSKSKGLVPAWIDEGLAVYFESAVAGELGHTHFELERPNPRFFGAFAREPDPYDLARILSFETSDFMASSRTQTKYAQAYVLVHFLRHGESERYRPVFEAFMQAVYRGQSTATDFRDALRLVGVKEKPFEKAWLAYGRSGG